MRLLKYGEVTAQTAEGIKETFLPRSASFIDNVPVESSRHNGEIVGRLVRAYDTDEDLKAELLISRTRAGDDLLALVKDGVMSDVSVGVITMPNGSRRRADGVIERTKGLITRIAVLPNGAYPSAQVLALRAADPAQTGETLTEETTTEAASLDPIIERMAAFDDKLDGFDAKIAELKTIATIPAAKGQNALERFERFGDYLMAAYDQPELEREWTTNVLTDNTAIVRPSWINDVKRIVAQGRPTIEAFGGAQVLPDTGMKVEWPIAPNGTYVGVQSPDATEVVSSKIDIDDDDAPVITYAGGAGISYQLLKRSTPSYREAILRLILGSWANVTNAAFGAALLAGSGREVLTRACFGATKTVATSAYADDIIDVTSHGFSIGQPVVFLSKTGGDETFPIVGKVYWVTPVSYAANTFRVSETPGGAPVEWGTADLEGSVAGLSDTTGAMFRSLLFEASSAVQDATGAPGLSVVASTDYFLLAASFTGLYPSQYGTSNVSGTADAASLKININGLDVIHDPRLAAGNIAVGNGTAAAFMEDGPHTVTAEAIKELAQDSVVYSLAASGIFVPNGIVRLGAVAAA